MEDATMETCPSPEIGDSRKRPLDTDPENEQTKRSHFSSGKFFLFKIKSIKFNFIKLFYMISQNYFWKSNSFHIILSIIYHLKSSLSISLLHFSLFLFIVNS